uniref:Uncharacterized protein n=1 Tax=Panagrolaimus sp. PS1159 TaxID=55785 RepID=A0AC35FYT6_9BILA
MSQLTNSKDLERFTVGSSMIDVIVLIETVNYLDNKESCYCNARTDDGKRVVVKGYKKSAIALRQNVNPNAKVAFSDLSATKVYFPQFSDLKIDLLFTENSTADLLKQISKKEFNQLQEPDEIPLCKVKDFHGKIIWTRGYLRAPLRYVSYPPGSGDKKYGGALYDDSNPSTRVEMYVTNDNEMLKRFYELDEVVVYGKAFFKGNACSILVDTYANVKLVASENQKTIARNGDCHSSQEN